MGFIVNSPHLKRRVLLSIDIYFWAILLIYLIGGISFQGRYRLGYIADFTRLAALWGSILVFRGYDLTQTSFVRAFRDFQEALVCKRKFQSVGGCAICFFVVYVLGCFILLPLWEFSRHLSGYFLDLGLMEQIIWRGAHGFGLTSTTMFGTEFPYFPNNHLNFMLYPISWIYRLFPYTQTLIVLKTIAILSAMIPLWKIGKEFLNPLKIAPLLLPVYYWCWDSIHRVNIWHFHETPFMSVFGIWAFYFFLKRNWILAALFTVFMAFFKEDAWFTAGGMAFYFFSTQKKWRWGLLCLVFGFAVFLGHAAFLNKVNTMAERYSYLGNSFSDAFRILSERPWILLKYLFRQEGFVLFANVLFAGGGIWLLSGWAVLGVIPVYLECALTTLPQMLSPDSHHIVGLGGALFGAVSMGLISFASFSISDQRKKQILMVTTLVAVSQLSFGEVAGMRRMMAMPEWNAYQCRDRVYAQLPKNVPLVVSSEFGGHLAGREKLWFYGPEGTWDSPEPGLGYWAFIPENYPLPKGMRVVVRDCGIIIARDDKL